MPAAPKPRMHGPTHVPGGSDPIPGLVVRGGGGGLYDTIVALEPDGFWPLDETTGTVAHDVSGNNHHLTSVHNTLVWGQPAGPPGAPTPELHRDRLAKNPGDATHIVVPGATDNFSAAVWVYVNNRAGALNSFMGFGIPSHAGAGVPAGWQFTQSNSGYEFRVIWAGSAAVILGDAAMPDNTWYLIGVSREAGTMKLYVNGVQQTSTSTTAPTAVDGIWLGSDDYNYPSGTFALDGRLSYAAYWGTRALTAAEHASLYATGTGYVAGGVTWSHAAGTPGSTVTSDYYLDTATGDIWFNTAGTWAKIWDEP